MPNDKSLPEPETVTQQDTGGGCQQEPCSAFLLQSATPTATRYGMRSRGRSFPIHYPGQPAVMMVGGIEWTSKIPRNEIECDQVNAWAAKIISQNETSPSVDAKE